MANKDDNADSYLNREVASEWEREFGDFDHDKIQFPVLGKVPRPINGGFEAYLPGIDGPGMFDPPAPHEEKSWPELMAPTVGLCFFAGGSIGVARGMLYAERDFRKRKLGTPSTITRRVRANLYLNYCTKYMRLVANNTAGAVLGGFVIYGMSQYARRERDYYNVVPAASVVGFGSTLRFGLYQALGCSAAASIAALAAAGVMQFMDGDRVLPGVQDLLGTDFFGKKDRHEENLVVSVTTQND
eukprot:CAMPEP_0119118542 /NCGR_PEP_ID=MMETSP1310-20130426/385_1 /TAXON_ID=464262 /ORGANISM="Genus nov. species nov., Strain RCC2339" /LENGTH=242 /DNA_ID=CAMNT_0007107921 /DNA_START=23 /DNA_END=751 /DNA_ORIENTATION=+